jgi:hypothetical protein
MTRRGSSILFASLLVVAQLLFGVMSAGAMTHDGAQNCDGCPSSDSTGMTHPTGSGTDHCGAQSPCSHDGTTSTRHSGCATGCTMLGSGHCGTSVSPALLPSMSLHLIVIVDDFGRDLRAVHLPDSPLFDFLRPPTRG